MTLGQDPFEPVSPEEIQAVASAPAKKPDRVPIMPVPADAPECTFKIPAKGGAPVRMWAYRDAEGRLLGYDGRFEYGQGQKDVLPITYCQVGDTQAWRSKSFPVPRPLYGLDRLAARPNDPVVIAEGCKSADAAGSLLPSYVPVSWPGGSNAISAADWSALADRDILIWPDRDRQKGVTGDELDYDLQPGTIAAENIVAKLRGKARSIRVMDLRSLDCESGWDAADALAEGWDAARANAFVHEHAVELDLAAPGTVLPYGYEYGADGLYYVEPDGGSRSHLCGMVKVLAKTRDTNGGSWGLLLQWRDFDGREHRWSMPVDMLSGDGSEIRSTLLNRGTFVTTVAKDRTKLLNFFSKVDTPNRARAVIKVGWAGNAFAFPEITIGDSPEERVIFQQAGIGTHNYQAQGTLEEWQQHVARLAVGNSRLIFMMSAAFVGPILNPACEEGGGVNVVGASSTGKSTGMRAAASVWGPPSFIQQWRTTSNGLEGVAARHNETFLCLDELSQIEPREAGSVAYMLGNGQGKARATRTGDPRLSASWKLLFLSTGEVGLADLMKEGKQSRRPMAGQEVRFLDVPADAGRSMGLFENIHGADSPEAFARQITTASGKYYGTAAIAFIERIVDIRDHLGGMISDLANSFVEKYVPAGADGQVQRGARRFGLIAAAGELAVARGILPWPKGEAFCAAGVMFMSWLARRGGTGSAEERNILTQVRLFFEQNGSSRFEPITDEMEQSRPVIHRAGFWQNVYDGDRSVREFYVLPNVFREEICSGFDLKTVERVLQSASILRPGNDNRSTRKMRLPGMPGARVYVIGPEVFNG